MLYTAMFMFRQCARLCVHVPCLMGEGDLLGTILISIINHRGCHFQIPFPLPNLLNLILYHTTKPSMRDGSDNERWLAHPCSTVQRQCQPGIFWRVFLFSFSSHLGCSVCAQPTTISSPLHPCCTVALFISGSSVCSSVAGVPESSILLDLFAGVVCWCFLGLDTFANASSSGHLRNALH